MTDVIGQFACINGLIFHFILLFICFNVSKYSIDILFAKIALVNGKYVVIQPLLSAIYLQPNNSSPQNQPQNQPQNKEW